MAPRTAAYDARDNLTMADFGFTPADRDTLTTLKVELSHLTRGIQELTSRLGRVEDIKVSLHDFEQILSDVDSMRQEAKALRDGFHMAHVALGERVRLLEQWRWMIIGGSAAGVAVVQLLFKILVK
jgi:hypothetical protein